MSSVFHGGVADSRPTFNVAFLRAPLEAEPLDAEQSCCEDL
jgi:hypothetical protein